MCGIAGIAGRDPIDRQALASATAALRHRGPDGEAIYIDATGHVGFGHTRLAIIDLSPAGAQPMRSHDGRHVITYNGEIYNFTELRDELVARGVRFRGHSDTEVLLEGFVHHGPAVFERLNGIFALAIHDTVTGEVLLARDPLGVKPLYYAETARGVVFASEMLAMATLIGAPLELDPSAIAKYLTFLWCPGGETPAKAIRKLEPGSAMLVRGGAILRQWSFWVPPDYAPRHDWTVAACAEELSILVEASVRRQMVSDAPLGAFLSGGLDSSAIAAAARQAAPDLQCFTIDTGEVEDGVHSDLPYARQVARHLGVTLHEVHTSGKAMAEAAPQMVRMLGEPLADPACLNVLFISETARRQGIKVLLSGAGGDDLFTGYRRHAMLALDPLWAALPRAVRNGLAGVSDGLGKGSPYGRRIAKLLAAASATGDRRIETTFVWGNPGLARTLMAEDWGGAADDEALYAPFDRVLAGNRRDPAVERCLALERFFLTDHNLAYTDRMSMAAGIETRVPLIDMELVRFAATIPIEWKLRGLTPKWIFKRSQTGVLPPEVINRPKTGFGAPLRLWMRRELRDLVEDLLSSATIARRGLFDPSGVAALRDADARGQIDGSYTLFAMMCVELWCREFIDLVGNHSHGTAGTIRASRPPVAYNA